MNFQIILGFVIGAMKYYILMWPGTREDALEVMQIVPIVDVWQEQYKTP